MRGRALRSTRKKGNRSDLRRPSRKRGRNVLGRGSARRSDPRGRKPEKPEKRLLRNFRARQELFGTAAGRQNGGTDRRSRFGDEGKAEQSRNLEPVDTI